MSVRPSTSLLVILEPGLSVDDRTRLMIALAQLTGVQRVISRVDEQTEDPAARRRGDRAPIPEEREYYAVRARRRR